MPIAGVVIVAMLLPIILMGAVIIPVYLGICGSLYISFGMQVVPYLLNSRYVILVFVSALKPMIVSKNIDFLFVAPAAFGALVSLYMFWKTIRYFGRAMSKKDK